MEIKTVFNNGGKIPGKYSCDGDDVSLPIEIIGAPKETKSFVLIFDDPDAPVGDWVHWILYNIPGIINKIEEGSVPNGANSGINDFKRLQYGGPCPPSGTHRYFLKIYALDCTLGFSKAPKKHEIEKAIQGHVLDEAVLIGLYTKKSKKFPEKSSTSD